MMCLTLCQIFHKPMQFLICQEALSSYWKKYKKVEGKKDRRKKYCIKTWMRLWKSSHLTHLPSGYIYWRIYKSPTLHQEMDCTEWPHRTFPSVLLLIWCRHCKTELAKKQNVIREMMDKKGEDNADRNNYLV